MAGYSQNELITIINGLSGLAENEKFLFAETLFLNNFAAKDVKNDVILLSGVRNGNTMPIFGRQDDFGAFETWADTSCDLPIAEIKDKWDSYKWVVGEIGGRIPLCIRQFTTDFNIFFNDFIKENESDVELAMVEFIARRFQTKQTNAEARVYFFADLTSTSPLINSTNGIFTQALAQAQANPELRVEITENATSDTFTDGRAMYDKLVEIYKKAAKQPWFKPGEMSWVLDQQFVFEFVAWLNTLKDFSGVNCDCVNPDAVVGTRGFTAEGLTIMGEKVKFYQLSEMMKASGSTWYDSDTSEYVYRNLILFTRNDNMLLGYEVEETLSSFGIHYNQTDRKIYIDGTAKLAPGLPSDSFIIGY